MPHFFREKSAFLVILGTLYLTKNAQQDKVKRNILNRFSEKYNIPGSVVFRHCLKMG